MRDLDLSGAADASAESYGWGLLAHGNGGTLRGVHVDATLALPDHGGLLIGNNHGLVEDCSAAGTITSGGNHVGGLMGVNENGQVRRSWSSATVNGARRVGGLIGRQSGTALVEESFAVGEVVGTDGSVGGLIGSLFQGDVVNCYARSPSVTSPDAAAGLVGDITGTEIVITNSYAAAAVLSSTNPDGLIGIVDAGSDYVLTSSYFLDTLPGTLGTALSDAQMRSPSSFSSWDFATVWQFDARLSPYPSLRFE